MNNHKGIQKKTTAAALCAAMAAGVLVTPVTASADSTSQSVITLGADLTDDQKQQVYENLGVSEDTIDDYDVITVTNEEEHEYLDSYLSSSVIGTKALSSCLVEEADSGSGVNVTTSNISYCTPEMYENALVTAGMKDATVKVTAPFEVSGTAALVGVTKAYSEMTGTTLDAESVDAAADELVTTQEVAESTGDSEKTSDLVAALKADVASDDTMTEDEMRSKIEDYSNQLGLNLTEDDISALITLMQHLSEIDLSTEDISSQLSDVYQKLKDQGIDTGITDEQANSLIEKISAWFASVWKTIQGWFGN